jgi:hypothetical protein
MKELIKILLNNKQLEYLNPEDFVEEFNKIKGNKLRAEIYSEYIGYVHEGWVKIFVKKTNELVYTYEGESCSCYDWTDNYGSFDMYEELLGKIENHVHKGGK